MISGDRVGALKHLGHWASLAAKLPVGTLIRRGRLDGPMRREAAELAEGIDDLRQALARGAPKAESAPLAAAAARATYPRCRRA